MNKQTLECVLTGQFASGKECKRVRCAIPLRIVSGALSGCTEGQVSFSETSPYLCNLSHTRGGSLRATRPLLPTVT